MYIDKNALTRPTMKHQYTLVTTIEIQTAYPQPEKLNLDLTTVHHHRINQNTHDHRDTVANQQPRQMQLLKPLRTIIQASHNLTQRNDQFNFKHTCISRFITNSVCIYI